MNPKHIAIIMDGNGRWAKLKGLSRIEGHKEGIKRVREIIKASVELDIKALTLYVFSMENWVRPYHEVSALMKLLQNYLLREMQNLSNDNVRFRAIGEITRFSSSIQNLVRKFEDITKNNTGLMLTCALSYSGRYEIINAVRKIVMNGIDADSITEETINKYLYTTDIPDPDLIIRTSGEMRLSNFLLWQSAYTELYFTNTYWPDFGREELINAIKEFQKRERRFGAVNTSKQRFFDEAK